MPIRVPVVLSPSRVELAARCHRRHVLHEVVDRRKDDLPSAAFGTVIHKAVANWWGNSNKYDALSVLRDEWNARRAVIEVGSDKTQAKHTLPNAEELLELYINEATYVPRDAEGIGWEPLTDENGVYIERRVEIAVEGKILSFQLDRASVSVEESVVIADLKTTSMLYRDRPKWKIGIQQKLYAVGVKKKFPWAKKIFNFIEALEKKPTPVFELIELPQWTDEELDEAVELWKHYAEEDEAVIGKGIELAMQRFKTESPTAEQIRECVEEVAVTQTTFNYMDCQSYFMPCPYLEHICSVSPELRIGNLWSDFEIHETEGY